MKAVKPTKPVLKIKEDTIVLTNRSLLQTKLIPALRKLYGMSCFDAKTAYRIHKILDAINKPYNECWGAFMALGLKYALADDKGMPQMHPADSPRSGQHLVDSAKIADYELELGKLLDVSFAIHQKKLELEHLTTRFSPEEISALQPIIEGLE